MTIFELEPVDFFCAACDSVMEPTACGAPCCRGYRCLGCEAGCDLPADPEHGRCATALASLPYELAVDLREELRVSPRGVRPVRTAPYPGECS